MKVILPLSKLPDLTLIKVKMLSWCRQVCTLILSLLTVLASAPVFANTIYGWIDRIEMQGTSAVIGGWTCQPSLNKSIDVFVYLGSAPPNGSLFRSTMANQALDHEVSAVCKTSGIAHRYTITLSSAEIMTHAGKAVYATGSSGAYSGALGNSGVFTVPEAPVPGVPGTPSVSVNNTSFNVSWSAVAFATRYQIRENQNNSGWQSPIDVGSNLSKSFSGATGNSYQYQIMACNNKGCSGWSNTSNTAVARGIAGYLDSATLNSDGSATVLGWGCDVTVSSPVTINLTVGSAGGTSLASGPTSVQAESAVNAICRTSGVAHRFQYRLSDSQVVQHKNKQLYATANGIQLNGSGGVFIPELPAPGTPSTPTVSVTGKQLTANWGQVSYASYYNIEQNLNGTIWQGSTNTGNSNSYSFTGATGNSYQFRVQACNTTGCSSWSAASTSAVAAGLHGYLDNIVLNTDNSADIRGWACDVKVNSPVYVDVNIGSAPTGSLSWKSALTTVTAENEVNNICRTTGIAHRFIYKMSQAEVISNQNKQIFANGRNASGQTIGLVNSGNIKVPQPGKYKVTASAGTGGSITPTGIDVASGEKATFTATTLSGYQIDKIEGCGASSTTSPFITPPITSACNVTATFKASQAALPAPAITPNGGTHSGPVQVCLQTEPGAQTRYSIDGSNVSSGSTLYTACFILSSSVTLKAKSFKAGMTDSPQSSAVFTVTPLNGPVTQYGYDARGRLIHIDDDKGVSATYALDIAGNRMVVQDQTAPPLSPEITMLTLYPDSVSKATQVAISWKSKNATACSLKLNRGTGEPEVINGSSSGNTKAIISSQTGVILTCVYREQSKSLAKIIKGPRQ